LNGIFGFALWDARRRRLLLVRDAFGVKPLYYQQGGGRVRFASEIKALLADPGVSHELDLRVLDQVFTYWSPLPGRTAFRDIRELPAGHYLRLSTGSRAVLRTADVKPVRLSLIVV
jgi:asparagine synthase (glutamine-hydrolysing)